MLRLPEVSGGGSNHSSGVRWAGAVMHMARCWHTELIAFTSPALLRATMRGSPATVVV